MHAATACCVITAFCSVRQVERPSVDQMSVSRRHTVRDKTGLLPEVEVVDGITTLTDHGRYQVVITRHFS